MNKAVKKNVPFVESILASDTFAMSVAVAIVGSVLWGYVAWCNDPTSTKSAGDLAAVDFSGDATVVITTVGVFRVDGSFQAFNGNPLNIRAFNNAPSLLCDDRTGFCRPLRY